MPTSPILRLAVVGLLLVCVAGCGSTVAPAGPPSSGATTATTVAASPGGSSPGVAPEPAPSRTRHDRYARLRNDPCLGGGGVPQHERADLVPATRPGGAVTLHLSEPTLATRPVDGLATTWAPDHHWPARERGRRGVVVFYTPHPDDETLSMGVLIADAVRAHEQVVVVALTDGRTTGAGPLTPGHPLDPAAVAQARDAELVRAVRAYGVPASDVLLAHLDAPGSECGAIVTVAEAEAVMRAVARHFPGAVHVTMSFVAERQQDHLDAGVALLRLRDAGVVQHALWTVSRLWWGLSSPRAHWVLPPSPDVRGAVQAAARQYDVWDPVDAQWALGYRSVPTEFQALALDVRDRVHGR